MPLGVGLGALQALAIAFVFLPIGLGALAIFAVGVWWAGDFNDGMAYILGGILGAIGWGAVKLRRAWLYRPSDAVFREDGLAIEGGLKNGASFEWKSFDANMVGVHEKTGKKGDDKRWILRIGETELAETDEESEGASLQEVAKAIRARVSPEEETAGEDKPAEILECKECGAAVAPTAEARTTCGHCDKTVEVPKDVRERVAASTKLTKKSKQAEKLVTKLLDQPGAGSTTALLWLSFVVIGSAWPVTIWAYLHLYRLQELTFLRGLVLATLPFLVIADGFFLSRLRLVDRRALGSLVMTFGAQPPARKGEPLRCRSCMGPLPVRSAVVVQCIYCDASNVTGVDLRANAQRVAKSARSLWSALDQRGKDRRTWRWRTLASLPFFVIVPLVVRDAFKAKEERWTFESLDAPGWQPHLSPDGKTILYRTNDGWALLDLATKKSSPIALGQGTMYAAYLKDGRIAYYANNEIRSADGKLLAKDVSSLNGFDVSVDRIAIAGSHTYIHRIGIGGGKEADIDVNDGVFAPDGRILGRDTEGVAFFSLDGKRDHVSETVGSSFSASPDGKRIVFFSESSLRIMSSGGWKKKTLLADCGNCKDMRWEHDGNVYFVRDAGIWRGRP